MFNEILETLKEAFIFIYDKILKFLIKLSIKVPALLTSFINYLIHYEILLAFGSLFAAIVFFKLLEGSE